MNLQSMIFVLAVGITLGVNSAAAEKKGARAPSRGLASVPAGETANAGGSLDVKGQVRSWNRLVGKGDRDAIDFVKERRNYEEEIKGSGF